MKRILIVEDNVGVGHVIAACLASADVTVTHNGPEALRARRSCLACDLVDHRSPHAPRS
jgi:CheY-like chemotaxis protein